MKISIRTLDNIIFCTLFPILMIILFLNTSTKDGVITVKNQMLHLFGEISAILYIIFKIRIMIKEVDR